MTCGAADHQRVERKMSLADCITTALEHNLDIQIERYNPLIADANLGIAYSAYDPRFDFRYSHDYNQDPGGRDDLGREYSGRESDTDSLSGGISGLLPSGMTYNIAASAANTYGEEPFLSEIGTNFITSTRPFENSRAQVVVGELRQPLLRNFWIDGTRLNIRLAKKDLRITDLNLRMVLINTVAAVEQAYYDLVAARENVTSAEIGFRLAERLYQENQKRVELGALAPLDERQALSQMAASEAAVLEARRAVDFQANILKSLLSDEYTQWQNVIIIPTDPLEALPQDFDVQEAWNRAFRLRPDLHALLVDLERRDLITRYNRNQLFPQLDVFGSFGWQGTGVEFIDALRQVEDRTGPRHGFGAILSFPLSNRRARETFRISKDERAQAELRLRQVRQQIMIELHDAIQQAESSFQRVAATRAARQYAEEALDAEQKKLENGRSTNFEVLRLQRDLTQARFDETRALADYNKAIAAIRQREGATLLKFNLESPLQDPGLKYDPTTLNPVDP